VPRSIPPPEMVGYQVLWRKQHYWCNLASQRHSMQLSTLVSLRPYVGDLQAIKFLALYLEDDYLRLDLQ
jgi:hypothetical protein